MKMYATIIQVDELWHTAPTRKDTTGLLWNGMLKPMLRAVTSGKRNDGGGVVRVGKLQNGKMPKDDPKSIEPLYL